MFLFLKCLRPKKSFVLSSVAEVENVMWYDIFFNSKIIETAQSFQDEVDM